MIEIETKQIISWLLDKAARAQDHSYARMLNMAAKRLKELDVTQNAVKWIPVSERLPDAHRTYLCRYGFNTFPDYLMTGCLDWIMFDKHPHWQHETTGLFVTHWMPLPEPPKEVE